MQLQLCTVPPASAPPNCKLPPACWAAAVQTLVTASIFPCLLTMLVPGTPPDHTNSCAWLACVPPMQKRAVAPARAARSSRVAVVARASTAQKTSTATGLTVLARWAQGRGAGEGGEQGWWW